MISCRKCGGKSPDNAHYCAKCGIPLGVDSSNQQKTYLVVSQEEWNHLQTVKGDVQKLEQRNSNLEKELDAKYTDWGQMMWDNEVNKNLITQYKKEKEKYLKERDEYREKYEQSDKVHKALYHEYLVATLGLLVTASLLVCGLVSSTCIYIATVLAGIVTIYILAKATK